MRGNVWVQTEWDYLDYAVIPGGRIYRHEGAKVPALVFVPHSEVVKAEQSALVGYVPPEAYISEADIPKENFAKDPSIERAAGLYTPSGTKVIPRDPTGVEDYEENCS